MEAIHHSRWQAGELFKLTLVSMDDVSLERVKSDLQKIVQLQAEKRKCGDPIPNVEVKALCDLPIGKNIS